MLLAPVIAGGRPLGVLMLLRTTEGRWTRAEVGRARVLAFALAPLLTATRSGETNDIEIEC